MADLDPRELRQQFSDDTAEWADIRKEGQKDMRYVAGDPWEEAERHARADAKRPCLSLDELGQYVNQGINNLRQNKRGIKVSPKGNGANDDTALYRQSRIRDIEYQSNAQQAYMVMAENMFQRSYGFLRITAQYVEQSVKEPTSRSFDQEPRIEPVVNPDMVTPDPYAIRPDFSDGKRLWYHESWSKEDFKARWKDAKTTGDFGSLAHVAPTWIKANRVMVAEYWVKELVGRRKVYLFKPPNEREAPIAVWADSLKGKPKSDTVWKERMVDDFGVFQYLTNGLEILEKHDWPGQSIPWVSCYGKVLYVDTGQGGKRHMLSLIRLARDPYMLYCYYRTCQAELVGMTPKFPYFVYEGQLSAGELANLQSSLQVPIAVIQVKPQLDAAGQQLLSFPQRNPYEPPIAALEMGAEAARRAIQAAMGISPLPTEMQRQNQKSGVALERIESSGQKGSYHFEDSFNGAVTRAGAILDELIPVYDDTTRDVSVRTGDDSPIIVRINDPDAQGDQAERNKKAKLPAYLKTDQGDHDVTISVGPAVESERQASADTAQAIIGNPQLAGVIGPQKMSKLVALAIKAQMPGPMGDQMAEIIDPPAGDGQQLEQQMAEMQQAMQQMQQQLQQAAQIIQTKQVENESRERIAAAEMQSKERIAAAELASKERTAALDREVKIAVAELSDKGQQTQLFLEERARVGVRDAEASAQALDHQHDVDMAQLEHDQALEAGEQGISGQLAVQASKPPAGNGAQA